MDQRRRALYIASAGGLLGAVLIAIFQFYRPSVDAFAARDPHTAATIAIWGMVGFVVVPVLGMAALLWRSGRPVLRVCAGALALTSAGMCYVLWRLAGMI